MPTPNSKFVFNFDLRDLCVEIFRYKKYNNVTDKFFADYLRITEVAFSYKLRGLVPFRAVEIMLLRKLLKLTDEQVGHLFFTLMDDSEVQ